MIHLTNWIINGLPERFPKLKVIWIESGLAWLPFMMQRLDHEYLMRQSDAPLLKKLPSEYMREMYYTSQPMEIHDLDALEQTFRRSTPRPPALRLRLAALGLRLPATIDLPFLTERGKRNILGENAARCSSCRRATRSRRRI